MSQNTICPNEIFLSEDKICPWDRLKLVLKREGTYHKRPRLMIESESQKHIIYNVIYIMIQKWSRCRPNNYPTHN